MTFANKPDGAAPTVFDSGQPAVLGSAESAAPVVSGGQLIASPSGSAVAAYYYSAELAGVATRIGMRFVFAGGSTQTGTAAMAITHARDDGTFAPDMSLHFVVQPVGWSFGVWDGPGHTGTGLQVLASGTFSPALTIDGETEYEAEAWVVGDTIAAHLPDGTVATATDSRVGDATYSGPFVFFEQFANNASTDNKIGFTHLWASSGFSKPAAVPEPPQNREIAYASVSGSQSVPTSVGTLPGLTISVPESDQPIMLEVYLGLSVNTAGSTAGYAVSSSTGGVPVQTNISHAGSVNVVAIPVMRYRIPPNTPAADYSVTAVAGSAGEFYNVDATAGGSFITTAYIRATYD